jgi:putative phosphoribosyl transferase
MHFADRRDAGRQLAQRLTTMDLQDPIVVGLPRGGVPVAYEVAQLLDAPLDILVVRKIGAPENPEYGIGAIAEGGGGVVNAGEVERLGVSIDELEDIVRSERSELARRHEAIRASHPTCDVDDRTVLLVDDGLATGMTAVAAARALRRRGAQEVILAVPVGAPGTVATLEGEVDKVICLETPDDFGAVGAWYEDFTPTSDDEVLELLERSRDRDL